MDFIEQVRKAMEEYLGEDIRRIRRAHAVAQHARELLDEIDADATLTLTAAYLHDIGIHEAERKHGAAAGKFRKKEGPAVARHLLEELNTEARRIDRICELITRADPPAPNDPPESRILWDAEVLVNLAETLPGKEQEEIEAVLQKSLSTEAGLKKGQEIYLS